MAQSHESDSPSLRWYLLAVGQYGEEVRATGTLSLADWIEPHEAAAVAVGTLEGINGVAHNHLHGGSVISNGARIALVLEYPHEEHGGPHR
jgi:hypothetical protein